MQPSDRYIHVTVEERNALLNLLRSDTPPELRDWKRRLTEQAYISESDAEFIAKATEKYAHGSSDDIEIDEFALVSEGDEGAFVQAWVYVRRPPAKCQVCQLSETDGVIVESTPCGSRCVEHLEEHIEDCGVCAQEFPEYR